MADVGYVAVASSPSTGAWEHTPTDKFFFHDGKWWGFFHDGTNWCLYERTGSLPTSPGDTGGWTKHLTGVITTGSPTVICDSSRDQAFVIGMSSGAATVQFRRMTYSGGSWSLPGGSNNTFNLCNTSGVGLGTTSTFKNSLGKLSIQVDPNGVPYVVAGNKGSGAHAIDGVHFAWPDNPSALGGTWSFVTIDSDLVTEGDASGKIAGFFSQGGTTYVVVCYCADNGTDKHKFAYHALETTMANYATGWVIVEQDATKACDNHIWGGVFEYGGETVIMNIGKDAVSRIWLFTSQLGAALTWTHKVHRVTNGTTDSGPIAEDASRGTGVIDISTGEFWVLYQQSQGNPEGFASAKVATLANLIAASSETSVFDTSAPDNGTPIMWDESANRMANPHGPSHPVTSAMSPFPVGCNANGTSAQWYNEFTISAPVEVTLAGVAGTADAGTLGRSVAIAAAGIAGTAAAGTVAPLIRVGLSGLAGSAEAGTTGAAASVTAAGAAAEAAAGSISITGDGGTATIVLDGIGATAAAGIAGPLVRAVLAGAAGAAAAGAPSAALTVSPAGILATAVAGTVAGDGATVAVEIARILLAAERKRLSIDVDPG